MKLVKVAFLFSIGIVLGIAVIAVSLFVRFEKKYAEKAYPGVFLGLDSLEGKTAQQIDGLVDKKNSDLETTVIEFTTDGKKETVTNTDLQARYNNAAIVTEALDAGRIHTLAEYRFKFLSFWSTISGKTPTIRNIASDLSYNTNALQETLSSFARQVDIPAVEPQFQFDPEKKRVQTFALGKKGQRLTIENVPDTVKNLLIAEPGKKHVLSIPIEIITPKTGDEDIDKLGITQLLSTGVSYYKGSIPGRIHNVLLASSRASGVLVAPNEIFSFNQTLGDISAQTGYKSAYVIEKGRTVLGDGGGVCQVSTTIFRAALNAGLDIIERKPHSYRVAYYEQGGFKPGLDATVYAPTVDLKIRNNTSNYILIQSKPSPEEFKLTYEIYGTADGRTVELSDVRIISQSKAPAPLYQEDPTLPSGIIKQVDWATGGAKTVFDYKVEKNGEVLGASTFVNNFKPWQAVYLYGPGTAVPTPISQ